ncbi:MAG: transposase [Desulfitobacteriaceae bacterium]
MARKKRMWWPGAIYHIMCRGNHRHDIFRDDEDREVYRSVLSQVKLIHSFVLHSYCLMTNHIHLQIETQDIDTGQIMKRINMKYAIYFNKKYRFVGQLMQGRYNSEVIDNNDYFLAVNRYIHLNPVKAGIVEHPLEYRWSSCKEYFSGNSNLIKTDKTLAYFNQPQLERYREFLESGISGTIEISQSMWEKLIRDDEESELTEEC